MYLYDDTSIESIYNYAKALEGKTFKEVILNGQSNFYVNPTNLVMEENSSYYQDNKSKGSYGHLLEKYFFNYDLNSSSLPDFPKAGLELKVTPLKINKNATLSSKERMVITIINFETVIHEDFETSHLMSKAGKILMVFYIHIPDNEKLNNRISNVYYFEIPKEDLEIIKEDWNKIISKIKSGNAHELSEGDTLYLGASTKGANKNSLRTQPNSDIQAMSRAFSFKNSYVNYIYNHYVLKKKDKSEKLIRSPQELKEITFEDFTVSKINKYVGMTEDQLCNIFSLAFKKKPKNIFSLLTFRMLEIKSNSSEEFLKANVVVKAIRLNEKDKIKEGMSFQNFKFLEVMSQEWEDSDFYNTLSQSRFLFVVYKLNSAGEYVLLGSQFWNMPYSDLENKVKPVWIKTRDTIREGVEITTVNGINLNNLPKHSENRVCHVRPHAKNSEDEYPLPDGRSLTKQCFWLSSSYILSQLDTKFFGK